MGDLLIAMLNFVLFFLLCFVFSENGLASVFNGRSFFQESLTSRIPLDQQRGFTYTYNGQSDRAGVVMTCSPEPHAEPSTELTTPSRETRENGKMKNPTRPYSKTAKRHKQER